MKRPKVKGPKTTRRWVLIADRVADRTITIGGALVIAAVLGMMVFLVYEVLPLFKGGSVESHSDYELMDKKEPIAAVLLDDYKTIAVSLTNNGKLAAWHAKTGAALESPSLDHGGKIVTVFAKAIDGVNIALGFSDGTVTFGKIVFNVEILSEDQLSGGLTKLNERERTDGRSVFTSIPGGQFRKIDVQLELGDDILISELRNPIKVMDYHFTDFGERPVRTLLAVDGKEIGYLSSATSKLNLFTRKVSTDISKNTLPALPEGATVDFALVNDAGDTVYLAEKNGKAYRFNTSDPGGPVLAETLNLTPPGVDLTVMGFLLGDRSLVVGGSDGSVKIYFLLRSDDAHASDGMTLVKAREFIPHMSAVSGFSPSQRGKTFATVDASGDILVRHGTSEKTLLRLSDPRGKFPQQAVALTPRLDGIIAVGADGRVNFWDLSIQHPEISFKTLFGKVWYEGYPEPSYTWQSTGGTDAFEPKLSLIPLIFGTLKATFYSLMFAIPLALLGAIYTSEFLPLRARGKVKPIMEIMASLPSVVLGFVAALVLAPVVETWIAAIILAFVVLPVCLILAACLWQILPPVLALRLEGLPKLFLMFFVVSAGMFAAYSAGPMFERVFFAGNFKAWLNRDYGDAAPLLFLLSVPVVAVAVVFSSTRLLGRRFNDYFRQLRMPYSAFLDLLRWLVMVGVTVAVSYVLAVLMNLVGMDPREGVVGTYVQRNTLIVGFAMGFAVIPIIYTLAEDALNAVPEHLRSASLGCGATPWQTAIWIVLPTAISGVFTAIMIGMGRAVGETMIVVMSTGNTPILDLSIFSGLRALSANIAVELPEAPKDGSLYRVLFLTALVLFAMTFVINTFAELVRLRFRKRAMQL
ncbi:MAG: ABC transporter permease subunit [Desulfomonile sp.]